MKHASVNKEIQQIISILSGNTKYLLKTLAEHLVSTELHIADEKTVAAKFK
jgi:hypothetical protein